MTALGLDADFISLLSTSIATTGFSLAATSTAPTGFMFACDGHA